MTQVYLIKLTRTIGIIFSVLGISLLIIAVWSIISTVIFFAKSKVTQGEITDIITTTQLREGKTINGRFPVVQFYDQNGSLIEYRSSFTVTGKMHIGEIVRVRYQPEKPTKAKISGSFWQMWGLSVILIVMGLVFAGLGLLFYRLAHRI